MNPAIETVVETPSIQQPQLSPDGSWLLYTSRQGLIAANSHTYSLWVVPTDGSSEPVRIHESPPTDELFGGLESEWSGDSRRVAVVDGAAVLVVELPGTESKRTEIGEPGTVSGLTWSPSNDQLALVLTRPVAPLRHESAVSIDLEKVFFRNVVENTVLDAQLPEPSSELWTLHPQTGRTERKADYPPGTRGIHWSGGEPMAGPPPGAPRGIPDPSGRWLAQPSAADWFCPPTLVELSADEVPTVAASDDLLRKTRMQWASDGSLLFATEWHMARHLFRLKPGEEPERLTPEGYHYDAFSAQGGQIAFVSENPVEPANAFVVPEADLLAGRFESRRLTHVSPLEPELRLSRRSWVSDGTEIEGYLVLPPEGVGSAPYPTLVDIQGGPTMVRMSQWSHFPNALFASQGFAVFVPGSRGRFGGYDKEFCHHIETTGFQLRDPLRDVLAGVEALVGDGVADPARVGISGHSYGAVLTSYAITQTDRFRAASFHEGMVEQFRLLRLYGASKETLAAMKHITGYGSPYDPQEAERIRQESPIDNMHTARVPTLIEAGEASLAYDAILLANALGHHGVPYELNLNPRTKHVVFEPKLFAEAITRNLQWFDYWLRDVPYPDSEKQAEFDEWKARSL